MIYQSIKYLAARIITLIVITLNVTTVAWSQTPESIDGTDSAIHFKQLRINDDSVHYAYSGNSNKPGLMFIHGTPGGWGAFGSYLANEELQKYFFMVSVDRPGWGKSQTVDKKNNGIFKHQADNIVAVLNEYKEKEWIVIGHSLGASLAPQIALQAPTSVKGLLLLAGSLDPKLGNPRWYNYAARTWVVSKVVSERMTQANREIMKLRKQLTIMDKQIEGASLDVDVIVIQGLKDKLVSPKNPIYVTKNWQDNFSSVEVIEIADAGHFIPWEQSGEVVHAIELLSNKIRQ